MRRGTVNFWVDALALASFLGVISTGALLRGFPARLPGRTVLGVGRAEWGDLHWVLSVAFLLLVAAHFLLHWDWVKANAARRIGIGPKALAIALAAGVIGLCVVLPAHLTRDLPRRKTVRQERADAVPSDGAGAARGAP
jgi:hypothetical protein